MHIPKEFGRKSLAFGLKNLNSNQAKVNCEQWIKHLAQNNEEYKNCKEAFTQQCLVIGNIV